MRKISISKQPISKNDDLVKGEIPYNSSFRRKPESSYFEMFWTPAFAGVTMQETFYKTIKNDVQTEIWNPKPIWSLGF